MEKLRILLVEDRPEHADSISRGLFQSDLHFELTQTPTLALALNASRIKAFNLLLLHLDLPDSQGISTFLTLSKKYPRVPILIISQRPPVLVARQLMESGCHDFLPSPNLSAQELSQIIQTAIMRFHYHQRQASQIQEASDIKARFLAYMSHEIRTPIDSILGHTSLLRKTPLNAEQEKHLHSIHSASFMLTQMVGDVLDLAKMEAGRMKINPIEWNVRRMVSEVVDCFSAEVVKSGVFLSTWIGKDVPSFVVGDAVRIRQILMNLVSNAVKFTAEGEISIHVGLWSQKRGSKGLIFKVSDTGMGMHADFLKLLFEPFTQANSHSTRSLGGSGLGMTLSRHLVDLLGGVLKVKSQPQVGTQFELRLPLEMEHARFAFSQRGNLEGKNVLVLSHHGRLKKYLRKLMDARKMHWCDDKSESSLSCDLLIFESHHTLTPAQLAMCEKFKQLPRLQIAPKDHPRDKEAWLKLDLPFSQSQFYQSCQQVIWQGQNQKPRAHPRNLLRSFFSTQTVRVLIAEGDKVRCLMVERMLTQLQIHFKTAHNGQAVLETLAKDPDQFDLILMDCQLPGLDGFDTTEEIKQLRSSHPLPIIAMTQRSSEVERQKCLHLGMDDYYVKPISLLTLESIFLKWLPHLCHQNETSIHSTPSPQKNLPSTSPRRPTSGPPLPTPLIYWDELHKLSAFETPQNNLVDSLLEIFVEKFPPAMEKLKLEIKLNAFEKAAKRAHFLVGLCSNIYATRLVERAKEIELCCKSPQATQRGPVLKETIQSLEDLYSLVLGELEHTQKAA